MNVLSEGGFVDDAWQVVAAADAELSGDVIVSLSDWERLSADGYSAGRLGLLLEADTVVEDSTVDFNRSVLIAIPFVPFTDGRGYSLAVTLRRRGYRGELRAIGQIQRDQMGFLRRCGFTSFAVDGPDEAAGLARASERYQHVYQAAADGREPLHRYRHGPDAAARVQA